MTGLVCVPWPPPSLGKERLFQLLYFLMGPIMLFVTLAFGAHNPSAFKMVATIGTCHHSPCGFKI